MAGGYAAWTQNGLPTELWSVSVGTVAVNRISFGRSPMHGNAETLHQDSDNLTLGKQKSINGKLNVFVDINNK